MAQKSKRHPVLEHVRRTALIVMASVLMAANLKGFVQAGGLFPGGFNGLALLIQRSAEQFYNVHLSFSLINFLLNAVPAVVSFRLIGKHFTIYSCLMIALTSILTDLIPAIPITNDVLLVCIFGGIAHGFAISLCLLGRATSGGTDFIAVAVSERLHVDAWNYILLANAVMLIVAGMLFGWDKALYSIIFQFASTQIVHMFNPRYKRTTMLIITNDTQMVYQVLKSMTHHSATLFRGTGLYNGQQRDMIYTVIAADEVKPVIRQIHRIDKGAFINLLKTDQVAGNFYQQPHD